MKKYIGFLLMVPLLFTILYGCSKPLNVEKVDLDIKLITLTVGDTLKLNPIITPAKAQTSLSWTSFDEEVASVNNNGLVTAISNGTTVITVKTANGLIANCEVTVQEEVYYSSSYDNSSEQLTLSGNGTSKIEDGVLELNKRIAEIDFSQTLSNTVIVESRVKMTDDNKVLSFFNGNQVVAAISTHNGILMFNNENITNYNTLVWHNIRVVMDTLNGNMDVYLDDLYIRTYQFETSTLNKFRFGSEEQVIYYDYLNIYAGSKPLLEVDTTEVKLNLDEQPEYTFVYAATGYPKPFVSVTCNKQTGFKLEGFKATFSEAGIYEFTIKAESAAGSHHKKVTITVTDQRTAPILNIIEEYALVFLNESNSYEFKYELDGGYPAPVVEIIGDKNYGFTITDNTVTFNEIGLYTFTVRAKNPIGIVEKDISILVKHDESIIDYDFNSNLQSGIDIINKGTGEVIFDGSYMNIKADGSLNTAFASIPFGEKLTDYIIVESRVMVSSNAFSNMLFFYNDDASDNIIASLAFQDGGIKYHDGSWKTAATYQINTWYDIVMVLRVNEAKFDLYINDEYIGTYLFRTPSKRDTITKLFIGSDKAQADMYYDYLKVSYATKPRISVQSDNINLDLNTNSTLDLNYEVMGYPVVTTAITCDQMTGFTLDGNKVTFIGAGTYKFTLTASNVAGVDSATITVNVTGTNSIPSLVVNENEVIVDIEEGNYTLLYESSGTPLPEINITCDKESGFTLTDNKFLGFTEEGTYVFTITATNEIGVVSKTITVVVKGYYPPVININQNEVSVDLSVSPFYELEYEIDSNLPYEVTITSDNNEGLIIGDEKSLGFTATGVYNITIKASNELGFTEKTLIVTVTRSVVNYFYNEDFDLVPDNLVIDGSGVLSSDNGVMVIEAGSTKGKVLYNKTFDSYLTGTIVYETRVKVQGLDFTNIMFLYAGTANVLGIAFENNNIRYHNGITWTTLGAEYIENEWYDLKAVIELGSGEFDFYVNGVKYSDLSLRTKGEVEYKIDSIKNVGIDNRVNVKLSFDYQRIYNLDIQLSVENESAVVSLVNEPTYDLTYTLYSGINTITEITCDKTTGYTLNDNRVAFTETGIYVFTITGRNAYETVTSQIAITVVNEAIEPELIINEDTATVNIAGLNNSYQLSYTTNDVSDALLTIECDQFEGFTIVNNFVTFNKTGVYTFIVKYGNESNYVTGTITVTVIEDSTTIIDYNFDLGYPEEIEATTKGTGSVTITDNVTGATGGTLNIKSSGISNSAFADIPFNTTLTGTVVVETRFMVTNYAFSNVLFFYSNNDNASTSIAACLAFQDGKILYHDGAWRTASTYALNTWYEIKLVLSIDNGTFDLYLDGVNIGTYGFRQTTSTIKDNITHLYIGSDKTGTDMYYDYLKVSSDEI